MMLNRKLIWLSILCIFWSACEKEPLEERLVNTKSDTTSNAQFDRTILLEPFTSISCGNCPLGHYEVKKVEEQYDDVIHLTHYLYGPLHHEYSAYVIEKVNKTMYTPLSFIQRQNGNQGVVYYAVDRLEEIIEGFAHEPINAEVLVSANADGLQGSVTVEVKTKETLEDSELGLTVVIVENSVIGEGPGYDQRNYGHTDENHPYYNQGEYIVGFEHTNVIRHVITEYDGDEVRIDNEEATWTGSFDTDLLIQDHTNYSIIAFLTEDAQVGSPVINAAKINL